MRAFQVAKNWRSRTPRLGPDFVERGVEFRAVLHQLRRYLEVFAMFHRMDANDDRRVSLEDFELAVPLLVTWRVNPKEAKAKFLEADRAAAKGGISASTSSCCGRCASRPRRQTNTTTTRRTAQLATTRSKRRSNSSTATARAHLEHRELRRALASRSAATPAALRDVRGPERVRKPDRRLDLQGFERVVS